MVKNPLKITDVVLRDAHQSLFATRMRIDDMLPIAAKLDEIGYWSLETWGGATFDSCIRFLGEDPWERLRELKKAMPKTPMQMLFRGQNILGYRHYGDDVVTKFVERAHDNGMDVFRIFDAMNDVRNFEQAVKAAIKVGAHAQAALSYTTSPVHTVDTWVDLAKRLEDMGAHSICIKDMSGLLRPYDAEEMVTKIKAAVDVPLALHCHATTGLSIATQTKAIEAGVDMIDTSISSMSQTYGHTATESIVAMLEGQERDTGLDLIKLEEISAYFREVRKKYVKFEGQMKGADSRILVAQVPGGMLTNLEGQLKAQGATDRLDEVLEEIPRVRKDLGYIPLVTPTSQIVGTQSVLNVLTGERYKSVTKETKGILAGEYGKSPAPVNKELQAKVLDGQEPITCRPADNIPDELEKLQAELEAKAKEEGITLAENAIDDVLTYALFPQVGLKFLKNRNNPDAFEPVPSADDLAPAATAKGGVESYSVSVNGQVYDVEVGPQGAIKGVKPAGSQDAAQTTAAPAPKAGAGEEIGAPLAGTIFKIELQAGDVVAEDDTVLVMEAMKMETNISATRAGTIGEILVKEGDQVTVGQPLYTLA